jgi:hypothetical protein
MAVVPRCPHPDSRFEAKGAAELLSINRPEDMQFSFLAEPWLKRAGVSAEKQEWFEALVCLRVTFNAWLGLVVTDRDYSKNDGYLWRTTALHPAFQHLFCAANHREREAHRDRRRIPPLVASIQGASARG